MAQYNSLNVKLSHSQLNKLKCTIKNKTEIVLRLLSNMIGNSDDKINFPHEILLTNRQAANLRKAFTKKSIQEEYQKFVMDIVMRFLLNFCFLQTLCFYQFHDNFFDILLVFVFFLQTYYDIYFFHTLSFYFFLLQINFCIYLLHYLLTFLYYFHNIFIIIFCSIQYNISVSLITSSFTHFYIQ